MPNISPSGRTPRPVMVPIGGGFLLPDRATATVFAADVPYGVKFELELEDGRYVCRSIECQQRTDWSPPGPPVTSKGMRQLPITRLMASALETQASQLQHESEAIDDNSDELLRVAAAYRVAYAVGLPPTKQVAEKLGLPGSTATKKVMQARKAGLLGPTTPGKAGTALSSERKG